MLWFFERGDERLQCEIRPSAETRGFELEWTTPQGQVHVERAVDPDELARRWSELQQQWRREGWAMRHEVRASRR
jgi:hypothetical protein